MVAAIELKSSSLTTFIMAAPMVGREIIPKLLWSMVTISSSLLATVSYADPLFSESNFHVAN